MATHREGSHKEGSRSQGKLALAATAPAPSLPLPAKSCCPGWPALEASWALPGQGPQGPGRAAGAGKEKRGRCTGHAKLGGQGSAVSRAQRQRWQLGLGEVARTPAVQALCPLLRRAVRAKLQGGHAHSRRPHCSPRCCGPPGSSCRSSGCPGCRSPRSARQGCGALQKGEHGQQMCSALSVIEVG